MVDRLNNKMVAEFFSKVDEDSDQDELNLFGSMGSKSPQSTDLFASPKFREIVDILLSMPILTTPTLNWLKNKQAQIARIQLEALYTKEELTEMYKNINLSPANST
jgi:hypothetical protein